MALTVEQIMECIENPVKTKILLHLQDKQQATAKEILLVNPSVPQATLYRHLKSMESARIIEVVHETKVRAVTEKTYAISAQFTNMEKELLKNNDGDTYYRIFSGFMLGLMGKFEQYAKSDGINIATDGSSFNAMPIYATAGQLEECARQIEKIVQPLMHKKTDDQQLHTLATIVTPPIRQED